PHQHLSLRSVGRLERMSPRAIVDSDAPRRVLVTGGSRGIGAAVCRALARDGFDLAINYHSNTTAAEAVATEIRAGGRGVVTLPFDVGDRQACADALA